MEITESQLDNLFRLELQNQYVAFLDVLGFKELVYGNKHDKVQTYFTTILKSVGKIRDNPEIKSLLVSDSIILTAPDTLEHFKKMLTAIRTIQCDLLEKKIILRGAISYGEVQYDTDNNIVFGKGYIKAYLLEQEAKFPRVIIDPNIIPHLNTNKAEFLTNVNSSSYFDKEGERLVFVNPLLRHDGKIPFGDEDLFVDYANKIYNQEDNDILRISNLVYDYLQSNIYSDNKVRHKYIWLKAYFIEFMIYTAKDKTTHFSLSGELNKLIKKFELL